MLTIFTIIPSEILKIGLNFLITGSMGLLFGPVPAVLGATAVDLIGYVVRPSGPYFFGFTINAMLTGFIYGCFFYRQPYKLLRVFLAKATVSVIINVILSTLWLSVLYGKAFFVLLPVRLVKNLVQLPFETALLFVTLKAVDVAWKRVGSRT